MLTGPSTQPRAATVHTAQLSVGEPQLTQQFSQQYAVKSSWQGPLPPPKLLAEFNEISPGLADRIVSWAEEEGRHSRLVESRALKWSIAAGIVGQVFAAGLAVGCLYASYHLGMAGHEGVAITLGGATLTTIVLAFLSGKKAATQDK
ncbi:hypothetical protein XhhCFBP4925_12255 [Xanthomonas hortorum pv. hederae]|nr:hypothetical protein XhhCFBP4925_12255 [Xanthomonas hortorum pv. hederae]PUE99600.1 DUF2335 domain-containing protein [Xanthomonas hortorum pv. hederae]